MMRRPSDRAPAPAPPTAPVTAPAPALLPALALALVLVATAAGLAGCGESTGSASDQPSGPGLSPLTSTPTPVPDAPVVVDLVSAASSGGQVESTPTTITTRTQQTRYLAGFEPRMTDQLVPVIDATEVAEGRRLTGTVVAVGCDLPEDVVVDRPDGQWRVVAVPAKATPVQCLVPVTTVALVELPA